LAERGLHCSTHQRCISSECNSSLDYVPKEVTGPDYVAFPFGELFVRHDELEQQSAASDTIETPSHGLHMAAIRSRPSENLRRCGAVSGQGIQVSGYRVQRTGLLNFLGDAKMQRYERFSAKS
jgi:hypothetical protein